MFGLFRKKPTPQTDPDLEYIISRVRYSTEPHDNIPFSEEERVFFQALVNQCRNSKINPREIRLTRMSSKGFNVDTHDGYIGKINLFENKRFMQYLIGMKTIKELHNPTLEECIAAIPYWVKHIKYCKRG